MSIPAFIDHEDWVKTFTLDPRDNNTRNAHFPGFILFLTRWSKEKMIKSKAYQKIVPPA